jgi:hypothetical protein
VLMKLQNSSFVLMMAVESSMGLKDPSIFIWNWNIMLAARLREKKLQRVWCGCFKMVSWSKAR